MTYFVKGCQTAPFQSEANYHGCKIFGNVFFYLCRQAGLLCGRATFELTVRQEQIVAILEEWRVRIKRRPTGVQFQTLYRSLIKNCASYVSHAATLTLDAAVSPSRVA